MKRLIKKRNVLILLGAAAIASCLCTLILLASPTVAANEISYQKIPFDQIQVKPVPKKIPKPGMPELTAAQDAWLDDLQSCESQNDPTQVNWHDRDGTPSYYAFQFKPGTFRSFGVAYRVIPRGLTHDELMIALKRTDLQRAIVAHMIFDPSIRWAQQFPDCTSDSIGRHAGMPPGAASDR